MRSVALFVLLITGFAAAGCTKHNGLNCNDGVCSDPNFPFCDESGQFGQGANTCIAVSCTPAEFQACHGTDALLCNAVGNDFDVMHCPIACEEDQGGCVTCETDGDCSGDTPRCSPDRACVACLDSTQCSDPAKPFCDDDTHACRGCAADTECDSKVCDLDQGTCAPVSEILYATPTGSVPACGNLDTPCTFQQAVNFAATITTKKYVKLLPGTYDGVAIPKENISIHAEGVTATGQIDVAASAAIGIVGLTITIPAEPAVAIMCAGSSTGTRVTLDHVNITVPRDGVIGCIANVNDSTLEALAPGTLLQEVASPSSGPVVKRSHLAGGTLELRQLAIGAGVPLIENTVFEDASPAVTFGGGIGTPRIRFSTFSNATLDCTNKLDVTNTIMVSNTAVETGSACHHHYVMTMPALPAQAMDDHVTSATPNFVDATHGDYHLMAGSPAIDAADPLDVSTDVDRDGIPRPQGMGYDLGAYEFTP